MMIFKVLLAYTLTISIIYSHGVVPNVVVFNTEGYAYAKTEYEINQIFKNFVSQINDIPSWEYIDDGFVWNQHLNVKNVKINENKTKIQTGELRHEMYLDRQKMEGSNILQIFFNFEFEAKTGVNTYNQGVGELVYTTNNFAFIKQQIKKDTSIGANATAEMDFNISYTYSPNSDDDFLVSYFKILFDLNGTAFGQNLQNDLKKEINNYYLKQEQSTISKFKLNITNPLTNYEVDLLYLENPKYETGKGITYYHCGEVSNVVKKKGFLSAPQPNHKKWDNFSTSDGPFQIFLGHHVLSELFSDISQTRSFKFNVDKVNLPKGLGFDLTINSLGMIAPNFYNEFPIDTELKLIGQIRNLTFDLDDSLFVGKFTLIVTILIKNTPIFGYETYIRYNLLPLYIDQKFNIRVNSPLEFVDMTIINVNPSIPYGSVDVNQLRIWTVGTINDYLVKNPFFIFRENIDFSKFFRDSKLKIIDDQGIVLAGNPNINYEISIPKNFLSLIYREFKDNFYN